MKKIIVFALYMLTSTMSPLPVFAVEALDYNRKISPSLEYQLESFLNDTYDTGLNQYSVANADLNGDGVDEHILKRKQCNADGSQCTHILLGERNDKILLLSNIRARHLMIGGTHSHGIKDILAFNNEINDYNFDIYMWSPSQKMYILKAQ